MVRAARSTSRWPTGCRWTLTADAYVTSFTGDLSCVETNGYTLYTAQQAAVEGV